MNKMDCKQIEKNLVFFIDKELSDKEMTEFNAHIKGCDNCSVLTENISEIFLSIKSNKNLPQDLYFYTRLQQRMDNNKSVQPSVLRKIIQPVALGLLLLLGGFMGIYIGNQYKSINMMAEESRASQLKTYAEENYLTETNTDNFEVLLTSNQ